MKYQIVDLNGREAGGAKDIEGLKTCLDALQKNRPTESWIVLVKPVPEG
jgi:hypothetical protein